MILKEMLTRYWKVEKTKKTHCGITKVVIAGSKTEDREEVWVIKACRRSPAKSGFRLSEEGVLHSCCANLRCLNFRCLDEGPVELRT